MGLELGTWDSVQVSHVGGRGHPLLLSQLYEQELDWKQSSPEVNQLSDMAVGGGLTHRTTTKGPRSFLNCYELGLHSLSVNVCSDCQAWGV